MSVLRAICKIIFILIWFFLMGLLGLILYCGKWKAINRLSIAVKLWSKAVTKIMNLKMHFNRAVPDINGIIVSNHLSYVDIVTTSSLFNIRFAPNTDVAKWFLFGAYLNLSRPIWVDRNSRQAAKNTVIEFVETIKHNVNLLVFPEGRISNGENGLRPFKSTIFEAAVLGNCKIMPVLLHYHDKNICWINGMFHKHLWNLLKMKEIHVDVHFLEPLDPNGMDRKTLAKHVHDLMDKKYRELYCRE
jgi:1-acyl-sn-glycerol-3-phosphate acyltransferase